jgi:CRP/FNR family cyclic AMP-dependent transcriptional regulator
VNRAMNDDAGTPSLLDALDEEDRRRVVAEARRRRFARNEVIFHEGDTGETLYVVLQGHVGLRIHTPLGDIATVRIVAPGQFFGELAVVSPLARNATAVALDRVEALALNRDHFATLRLEQPQIDALLTEALVTEVRRLAQQVVELMYVPVDKRIWRKVLELARMYGTDDCGAVEVPLTQDVLAQLTGCTRSSANRVLRGGEDEGLITMQRGRITVLDVAKTERRAH